MIKIKIGSQEMELDYEQELQMDEATINEDLKNQPSLFAFYAVLAEKAHAELNESKLALEILEADIDARIRGASEKKPTEKQIQQQILLDNDYQEARMDVIRATKQLGILKGIKDAFNHRKEAVIALASNMRVQADPSIFVGKEDAERKLGYRE